MQEASHAEVIRRKFLALEHDLDERARRRWAAVEAQALGRGGISTVARATGMSRDTVRAGVREIADPHPLTSTRQRRVGGGRKPDAGQVHEVGVVEDGGQGLAGVVEAEGLLDESAFALEGVAFEVNLEGFAENLDGVGVGVQGAGDGGDEVVFVGKALQRLLDDGLAGAGSPSTRQRPPCWQWTLRMSWISCCWGKSSRSRRSKGFCVRP